MNMSQLAQEMQRVQTEYAANPTPENLMKMQSEIMRLQQEMVMASMQTAPTDGYGVGNSFFAEAQDAAAFGQLLGQSAGELFGGEDDAQEVADFIAAHPPAPDKAKYLPIGAFLLSTNGEPGETFALMGEQDEWLEAISEGWDIQDAQAGREMLQSLLQGMHTSVFDGDYQAFKAGQPHDLDEDSVEAYHDMLESLREELPVLLPYAQSCQTILAWDLERAGYLARIFAHLGWLSEAEAFDWLGKAAAQIKQTFQCWEQYTVSIMIGRALHFESADPVISAACELFDRNNPFLSRHPFSAL